MRLNLERGFRRITWGVSMAVLTIGGFLIVPDWWSALILWNQAGEPPSGDVEVYVSDVDVFVTFPKDFTEAQVKDVLDKKTPQVADKARGVKRPPLTRDELRALSDDELIALAQRVRKPSLTVDELLDRVNHPITYIYQPPSATTPSVLYSRRAILQAEAESRLPQAIQTIVGELRTTSQFPSPVRSPFGGWVISELFVLALCVTALWGVFFLVRWIVLGFKPD